MFVGFGMKTYYSIQHIKAAAYLARRASVIESDVMHDTSEDAVALKAYVSSVLFSSVAFLEALANEMFADAMQSDGGHLSDLPAHDRALLASIGETESVQKASILAKYDLLLRGAGKAPLSKDTELYRSVATLVKLRNEIVHYKASFFDVGTEGMVRAGSFHQSKLPQQIKGKFNFRKNASPLSGDGWLSHGCAQWAVTSVIAFADSVFNSLGVQPYFDHVREHLGTSSE